MSLQHPLSHLTAVVSPAGGFPRPPLRPQASQHCKVPLAGSQVRERREIRRQATMANRGIAMGALGYRKRRNRKGSAFDAMPASQKKFMFVILGGGLLLMMGLASVSSEHLFGLLCLGGGAAAVWWGSAHD
jgi:hypothetical protein